MILPPPDYFDTTYELALKAGCDLVQLKYDGIYGRLELGPTGSVLYSKTNKPKDDLPISFKPGGDIRGEYMYGSQWSQDPARKGKLFVFDIASVGGEDLLGIGYLARQNVLRSLLAEINSPSTLCPVESFPINSYHELWKTQVLEEGFEGMVFRKSWAAFSEPLGRQKSVVTRDFVCTGFYEGEGKHQSRLGGIICSLFKAGRLEEVCRVGGGFTDVEREVIWANQQNFINRIVEIKAQKIFASGAPRHPNFVRWHPDKSPQDCTL